MSDGADPREYHQGLGRMRGQPAPTPAAPDVEDWVTQQFKDPEITKYLSAAAEACAGLSTFELEAIGEGGVKRLQDALTQSVVLQSHYAKLLNEHDGGKRAVFTDPKSWLERLEKIKKPHMEAIRPASEELLDVAKAVQGKRRLPE